MMVIRAKAACTKEWARRVVAAHRVVENRLMSISTLQGAYHPWYCFREVHTRVGAGRPDRIKGKVYNSDNMPRAKRAGRVWSRSYDGEKGGCDYLRAQKRDIFKDGVHGKDRGPGMSALLPSFYRLSPWHSASVALLYSIALVWCLCCPTSPWQGFWKRWPMLMERKPQHLSSTRASRTTIFHFFRHQLPSSWTVPQQCMLILIKQTTQKKEG